MKYEFELISFALCPYVQRSAITLLHKKVPFTRKNIDLFNPPEWFEKMSPLGKVPLLVVNGKTVLFESAVINEFLDEVAGGERLISNDPIEKAQDRAWIEFGSECLSNMYGIAHAENAEEKKQSTDEFFDTLSKIEPIVSNDGPLFHGRGFSLVDSSFAPMYMRMKLHNELWNDSRWKSMPKTRRWAEALLKLPEVRDSVHPEFEKDYHAFLAKMAG